MLGRKLFVTSEELMNYYLYHHIETAKVSCMNRLGTHTMRFLLKILRLCTGKSVTGFI